AVGAHVVRAERTRRRRRVARPDGEPRRALADTRRDRHLRLACSHRDTRGADRRERASRSRLARILEKASLVARVAAPGVSGRFAGYVARCRTRTAPRQARLAPRVDRLTSHATRTLAPGRFA